MDGITVSGSTLHVTWYELLVTLYMPTVWYKACQHHTYASVLVAWYH